MVGWTSACKNFLQYSFSSQRFTEETFWTQPNLFYHEIWRVKCNLSRQSSRHFSLLRQVKMHIDRPQYHSLAHDNWPLTTDQLPQYSRLSTAVLHIKFLLQVAQALPRGGLCRPCASHFPPYLPPLPSLLSLPLSFPFPSPSLPFPLPSPFLSPSLTFRSPLPLEVGPLNISRGL